MSNPNFPKPSELTSSTERRDKKKFNRSDIFTLSPEDLEFLSNKASNPELRKKALQSQRRVEVAWEITAASAENLTGSAERITVLDSIKQNPETFNKYKLRERSEWAGVSGLWTWTEKRDFSEPEELKFVQTAKRMGDGNFTEILQISFVTESGRLVKGADMSGGAEVDWNTISSLSTRLEESISERIESIYFVHNHSDYLAKTKIPKDYPPDEFIEKNGLSISDIDLADKFKVAFHETHNNVAVFMIAIDEMGFTHSYEAGGSRRMTQEEWKKRNTQIKSS